MKIFGQIVIVALVAGCQSIAGLPPIKTAESVDLQRFSGDWYVIASIPTFVERDAYNAVESYAPPVDGKIATTFTFNKGGFEGSKKTYTPTGFVRPGTGNAVWGMQFVWPIKAEYRIIFVDDAYELTIIGRTKRDFVWLMARTPHIDEAVYASMTKIIADQGYDLDRLRRVPHQ